MRGIDSQIAEYVLNHMMVKHQIVLLEELMEQERLTTEDDKQAIRKLAALI